MRYIEASRRVFPLFLFACFLVLCAFAQTSAQVATALTIQGAIPETVILKSDDLAQMPRLTESVADHDGRKVSYEGVSLQEILKRARVPFGKELRGKALVTYVLAKAHDGYQVVFSLGELDGALGNETILVADKRDGKPLSGNLGPLRLVCPNDEAGARSVRMLETLEIVRLQK